MTKIQGRPKQSINHQNPLQSMEQGSGKKAELNPADRNSNRTKQQVPWVKTWESKIPKMV